MPQLHCYVPEAAAQQLHRQAADLGLSMSAYLAELVKRDVSPGWPEGFEATLFGAQVSDVNSLHTIRLTWSCAA